MTWMQISAIIVVIGAELNSESIQRMSGELLRAGHSLNLEIGAGVLGFLRLARAKPDLHVVVENLLSVRIDIDQAGTLGRIPGFLLDRKDAGQPLIVLEYRIGHLRLRIKPPAIAITDGL